MLYSMVGVAKEGKVRGSAQTQQVNDLKSTTN